MAKQKPSDPLVSWSEGLEALLASQPQTSDDLTTHLAGKVRKNVEQAIARLTELAQTLDPIKLPGKVFNPADPTLVGPFIGLGLLAQPRHPLPEIGKFYGSGVYAIYYKGEFDAYAPLKGTEHPIYVGKADPEDPKADTPQGQGPKLSGRLNEHARSIGRANNLNLEDFECRFLVISSGWQESAESFLIRLYDPVWNNETGICHGLGKHGDSGDTRANKRSPWDTLHPGRTWAAHPGLVDQFPESTIRKNLADHFAKFPPVTTTAQAFDKFFEALR